MNIGDTVRYIGCTNEQINWGNNDDPRSFLIIGREYIIENVEVHSSHTKISLCNKWGKFNSVCFEVVNSKSISHKKMDPSEITLDNPSKMFEYEKISREIESCNDIEQLKNMCRCFLKLHLKHQEVTTMLLKDK
jgi:hypothetical protein